MNLTHKVLSIASIVVITIFIYCFIITLIKWSSMSNAVKILFVCSLILMLVFGVLSVPMMIEINSDKELVNQNEFMVFEGEIVGFKFASSNRGIRNKYGPILKNNESGKTMCFNILDAEKRMEIGSTYKVVYLPNTGYAEIIEGE